MVESAPLFIEYCCVGYMHIDAVKALIFVAFGSALACALIASTFDYFLSRRKSDSN